MKKQVLLGSTALIVGALAAPNFAAGEEPLRLEVRGYKNEYFAFGDVDNDSNSGQDSTSEFSDGEVHFKGSTTLDNGLTFGVDVQLEADNNGDQVDESYTWIKGDFGKVVIGSENLPDYLTFWGVTAPGVGVPINSGWISVWSTIPTGVNLGFRSPGMTTNLALANDTFGFGYQSPRFSGFGFGLGYTVGDGGGGNSANGITDTAAEVHDIVTVGVNFSDSFNGVDVGFAAGYGRGSVGDTAEAAGADDPNYFKVGASIGVSGFSVAGSYSNMNDGVTNAANTTTNEGESFDIGASYSTGPWGVSATYFHGEQKDVIATAGEDEVDSFVGAVSYALGPGITASLSVIHSEWEDEAGVNETDSTMGVIGLSVGF